MKARFKCCTLKKKKLVRVTFATNITGSTYRINTN